MPKNKSLLDVEHYRQLFQLLGELTPILNTEKIFDEIVVAATKLFNAEAAWFMLLDQYARTLQVEAGKFPKEPVNQGYAILIDNSLEGWVIKHQQPIAINDSNNYHQEFGQLINLPGFRIRTLLSVPISYKGKQIGVLDVANKLDRVFSKLDQEIAAIFASQAAICIDNSHRFVQSDLVTELVHELHTPLASLNTALHLLKRPDLPEAKREHVYQMIQSEFVRLSDLTTTFMDYARLESGRTKFDRNEFDLARLIVESVEVMQMQADSKGMKISFNPPGYPLVITADRNKIKQVILNLLSNAIKYNHAGGKITVSAHTDSSEASFSIQDNGHGIPMEYLLRLFDRFFRAPDLDRNSKGIGLGLTICKQIVEAHQGRIEVSSTVGEGSTFSVHLPIKTENQPRPAE